MMVKVKGRMSVNVVNGRSGQFSVATLYSEIGEYVVRYGGLDQYEPGTYEGEFWIRDTDVLVRPFGVGKIIEPVAFLDDLILIDVDEGLQESLPEAIPDPAAEDKKPRKRTVEPPSLEGKTPGALTELELKQLFGEAWPLGESVKLDPTIGRTPLRAQTQYLKSTGYKYKAKEQTWIKQH
jgi:hypothetical protein